MRYVPELGTVYVLVAGVQIPPPTFLLTVESGTVVNAPELIVAAVAEPFPFPSEAIKTAFLFYNYRLPCGTIKIIISNRRDLCCCRYRGTSCNTGNIKQSSYMIELYPVFAFS
jgi:hypothetical protein